MSARGLSGLSYARARQIILAAGLLLLLVVAAVMFVRRVDPIEVAATLLFIPIFIAFVFKGVTGGIAAAVVAALAYAALRYPAIQLVGAGRFTSLLLSRAVAFLAFGALGGFASQQLEASLSKLDQFDEIDDATGLFNARFFVNNTQLEMERSDRYRTLFSVTVIDVPAAAFEGMNRRQKDKTLRELGQVLKDSIRTVDRGVHAEDGNVHRFAAILPETGRDGSRVFVTRLATKMTEVLAHKGSKETVSHEIAVFPGDEADLGELRARFTAIDALQHPETAEATA
jgi:GGDEF domain-containing protein